MPNTDLKNAPARKRIKKIIQFLAKEYEPVCGLRYKNPFELLITTILSAQCTDERVNKVTPALFERFPDAKAFTTALQEEVEDLIRSTGFFRQKTKSIIAVSHVLTEQYGGEVPQDMVALTKMPGIGRKTANVVLGTAFGFPAITVDTHVKRLATRLRLTDKSDPDKIEQDLIALIPAKERTDFSHRLIWHGRKVCAAKKPKCGECILAEVCPSNGSILKKIIE
ncbi:MAG: endonuclease III [Candidatus Omnitrophota bacterium]|jgi:endonuclease-3|nr:MAG: endonuclease III [Candidatus Omnitrophota bacterium]